mmetsp:Transcript_43772/g.102154  ORF Transcript_43772/g.102154 Transcript_43772/m.102154 type:complete len:253 (-) Transcript_43772:19-777(-)
MGDGFCLNLCHPLELVLIQGLLERLANLQGVEPRTAKEARAMNGVLHVLRGRAILVLLFSSSYLAILLLLVFVFILLRFRCRLLFLRLRDLSGLAHFDLLGLLLFHLSPLDRRRVCLALFCHIRIDNSLVRLLRLLTCVLQFFLPLLALLDFWRLFRHQLWHKVLAVIHHDLIIIIAVKPLLAPPRPLGLLGFGLLLLSHLPSVSPFLSSDRPGFHVQGRFLGVGCARKHHEGKTQISTAHECSASILHAGP